MDAETLTYMVPMLVEAVQPVNLINMYDCVFQLGEFAS